VGAVDDEGGTGNTLSSGAVYLHFMNTDGSIQSTLKLDENTANGPDFESELDATDWYGRSVASIGDLDGDGVLDLAVGAMNDEGGVGNTLESGAVYIHYMNNDGQWR